MDLFRAGMGRVGNEPSLYSNKGHGNFKSLYLVEFIHIVLMESSDL